MRKLSDKQILKQYDLIKKYHSDHLKEFGVRMPNLKREGKYTEKALALICLSSDYPDTKVVSKDDLADFIHKYRPDLKKRHSSRKTFGQARRMVYHLRKTRRYLS